MSKSLNLFEPYLPHLEQDGIKCDHVRGRFSKNTGYPKAQAPKCQIFANAESKVLITSGLEQALAQKNTCIWGAWSKLSCWNDQICQVTSSGLQGPETLLSRPHSFSQLHCLWPPTSLYKWKQCSWVCSINGALIQQQLIRAPDEVQGQSGG